MPRGELARSLLPRTYSYYTHARWMVCTKVRRVGRVHYLGCDSEIRRNLGSSEPPLRLQTLEPVWPSLPGEPT